MTCTSRCRNAKGDECKCSCDGSNHGIYNDDKEEANPVKRMREINNPNHYYLCEYSFVPFPHNEKNPKFALGADIYAWISHNLAKKYRDRNHALAIWKDMNTNEFVVRKEFREATIVSFFGGVIQTNIPNGRWEEVYRGINFQEALDICTIYGHKYHNSKSEWKACDHSSYQRWCTKHWKVKV